ncbi:TetR/AcrR family transcriptional regulator [Arthrobacter sp. AFG20]|uniref:TetR/AcrR family transcriptional regulator n=1 Tax=Arthrobacter sp. AFG20 TaxID=1688671 RepID=UPI000C9E4D61|nr:TetR/AcrR family transcriptional regulator [Arthrobacter sp. AFG20]PNH78177.1 TetR family transcriptional regulator [Arthrobacter sp. AFG20]
MDKAVPAPPAAVPGIRGPRGPYRSGVDRRREILEAAVSVFAREGYRAGSLRDVARSLGLTPGAIIHHFGSKEQLLVAVLDTRDDAVADSFPNAVRRGLLIEELRKIVAANENQRGLTTLYATLAAEAVNPDHPAHEYFIGRYQRILQHLEEGIREEQEQGILPLGRPAASLARALLATMDGLQLQWLLEPSMSMTEAFDEALRTLNLA